LITHVLILVAMAVLLREDEVRALASMGQVIEAVAAATADLGRELAQNQPRRRVFPASGVLNVMSASWATAGVFGLKTYSVMAGRARFVVLLYGPDGSLSGLIEADHLGALRTGAASAVAARALAPAGPLSVGVIGTGKQAGTQIDALREVLQIAELRVYGRDQGRREAFAGRHGARAVDSARACVEGCDVVVTMTTAREPVLESDWIGAQTLVIAAGSNYPNRRELPADLVHRARAIVVDQRATAELESGDLLLADYSVERALELGGVLAGLDLVPEGPAPLIFESHGLALWDIAAAHAVLLEAGAHGVGESVAFGG